VLLALFFSWSLGTTYSEARTEKTTHKKVVHKKPVKKKAEVRKRKPVRKAASQGVEAKAVYCINLRDKETVIARNADKQLPVASLSKLITALVTLDGMPLDRKITVPDHIKSVPKSVVGLKAGDKLTVEDVLHGLLIGSGNDCAETLACAYPGGKQAFVNAMNKKVRSLGMRRTVFYTPSGLDKKGPIDKETKEPIEVDSNVSTAREIGRIAEVAFANPVIRGILGKKTYTMASTAESGGYSVRTTNKLLRADLPVVGGKTGFTARAGHCLASEFRPGRNAFIIVVLGSRDHFRDTRLVYHKALKEATRIKVSPKSPNFRHMAAHGLY
jgi:D-alanyl-D-alanine carboxypeptidase